MKTFTILLISAIPSDWRLCDDRQQPQPSEHVLLDHRGHLLLDHHVLLDHVGHAAQLEAREAFLRQFGGLAL